MNGAVLYVCRIMHRRPGPPRYRFAYRSFYLLLDVDAIDDACAATPLLSRNRFNLLSFYDRDHGGRDGSSLRVFVDNLLARRGVDLAGGRIRLLAMPRVLGYGFNPISVFYCQHADGTLRAIVAEVHNTFGEQHCYVLEAGGKAMDWTTRETKHKRFHVSPFFNRQGVYRFHFSPPGEQLGIGIRLYDTPEDDGADNLRIATALKGECIGLSTANVLKVTVQIPLLPFKVITAIYWQAFKLWLRGTRWHAKPAQEHSDIS